MNLLRKQYFKKSTSILSNLLLRAFIHKKYSICRILLEENVRIQDFTLIFERGENSLGDDSDDKQFLIE